MSRRVWCVALCTASIAVIAACSKDGVGVDEPAPLFDAASVDINQHNVLSAVVSVHVRHADSVVVLVRRADAPATAFARTPRAIVEGDAATVPVLELDAGTRYVMTPIAYRGRRDVR